MKNPIFLALAAFLLLCHCRDKETPLPPDQDPPVTLTLDTARIVMSAITRNSSNYSFYHYRGNALQRSDTVDSGDAVILYIAEDDKVTFQASNHTSVSIKFMENYYRIDTLVTRLQPVPSYTTCNSGQKRLRGTARDTDGPVTISYFWTDQRRDTTSRDSVYSYSLHIPDMSINNCLKDLRFWNPGEYTVRILLSSNSPSDIELDVFLDGSQKKDNELD